MSARRIYIIAGAVAVAFVVLYLFMMPEGIPASSIQWQGVFGWQEGEKSTIYGLIRFDFTVISSDIDQVTAEWLTTHPQARAVPVFSDSAVEETDSFWDFLGIARRNISSEVYVWVLDGDECLNLHLVRKGCYSANPITMDDISELRRLASECEDYFQLHVSEDRYNEFIKNISAAQDQAKKEKLGIWKTK